MEKFSAEYKLKNYGDYTGMPVCPPEQYAYAIGLVGGEDNYAMVLQLMYSTNAANWVDQSYGSAWRVRVAQALDRVNNPGRTVFDPEAIESMMTPEDTMTDAEKLELLTAFHPYGLPFEWEQVYQALSNPQGG